MAIMTILHAGDEKLKKISEPVSRVDKKIKQLLDNMAATMYAADGVGLAAPQVGINKRIVVIDIGEGLLELINPVIIKKDGRVIDQEGCLSVPGIYGDVERYQTVTVEAWNRQGKKIRIFGEGMLSKALQHEIDHLDGILFIDKAQNLLRSQVSS